MSSDIAFSMSMDEKDVLRGLHSVGKETGKLREQISDLVTANRQAGAADNQLSQLRIAALTPIIAKQKELRAATDAIAGLRMRGVDHDTLDALVMLGLQQLAKQTALAQCEDAIYLLQAELDHLQLESSEAGT